MEVKNVIKNSWLPIQNYSDGDISTVLVFIITAVSFYAILIWKKFFAKKKLTEEKKYLAPMDLPGPNSFDPTGILGIFVWLLPMNKAAERTLKWHARFGDTCMGRGFGQHWVFLGGGPQIKTLLLSNDFGHITKPDIPYGFMKPFITNGVLVSSGKFWQHQRKALMKTQSFQNLKAYIPMLNKHARKFVSGLEELFKDGGYHPVNDVINSSFIKIISEMITGFDNDKSDEYLQYHYNFQVWKEVIPTRFLQPWLLLNPIWRLHPLSRRVDVAVNEMFDFAKRRVAEHKEARAKQEEIQDLPESQQVKKFRTVLDELVDAGVDERQIIDEINTMMFGGHETGAGAIHLFMFCMAINPEVQKECQLEVDELFESGDEDNISYEVASGSLKYLERCILETLRLYPPVAIFLRKLNSPLILNVEEKEYLIPSGTNMCFAPFLTHRNARVWPDPNKFDPDRFLPEEVAKRHPYDYIPFSGGPKNCLGIKFAMIEMKIIAAHTLRQFNISSTDKPDDIPLLPLLTLTPERDYTFKLEKRLPN